MYFVVYMHSLTSMLRDFMICQHIFSNCRKSENIYYIGFEGNNRIILYLDWVVGYTQLHVLAKICRTEHLKKRGILLNINYTLLKQWRKIMQIL